jgi:hypothetical protein
MADEKDVKEEEVEKVDVAEHLREELASDLAHIKSME